MDAQEIRTLLGKSIFERAQKYRKRILQSSCTTNEDGVRHLTALVQGSGPDCYYTQVWLRENGSFVSASCDCPYNQNGDGTYCKHIGALLLQDAEKNPPAPEKKPESIPGVQRGVAGLNPEPRKDSYSAGLDMLFGRKWRGEEPETDYEAQLLLKRYQREDAQPQPQNAAQRTGFALLEPELTPHNGRIWLRLRVSDGIGGRQYLVKSIPQFLDAIERGESVSYGKSLAFVHRWDAFAPDAQQLLRLLRRQVSARQAFEAEGTVRSGWEKGPAGGLPLTGEGLDALVELYAAEGVVGGYTLKEGLPVISLKVERRKGGVQLSCTPALSGVQGLDYAYLLGESTLWRMQREECRRVLPVLDTFGGRSLFFTSADAAAFCSYVLPELGNRVNIVDPDRLLLNQIPLEPVVQFYLDADRGLTVTAYPVFLYGEDRVAPGEPVPPDLLRDARTENRAKRLLETYLEPETGKPGYYSISGEEALFQLLEEGIPALLAMGEVYQTDAFRNLQAAPPKISVGVSVHGSVLDLEVDTGAFPVEELRELLQSLHQKKRYHRLRDGSLLRLDDSLEGLDELNDTLELSGAKLKDGHAALPLYRAPHAGLGAFGTERSAVRPGRCLPAHQPQLPRRAGQRVYPAALPAKDPAQIPAGRLPLAAHTGRLRHGRHSGGRYGSGQDRAGAQLPAGHEGGRAAAAQPHRLPGVAGAELAGGMPEVHPAAAKRCYGRRCRPPRRAGRWVGTGGYRHHQLRSAAPGRKNCMPGKAFTPAFWTKRRPSKTTPPRNTRRCAG